MAKVLKIVREEYRLEDECRGIPMDPSGEVIQNQVADIVLSAVGEQQRRKIDPPCTLP